MLESFPNKVVRKSYAIEIPIFSKLPRYICEYLISQHQNQDGLLHEEAIQEIENDIKKFFPDPREGEKWLSRLMDLKKIQVIDHYQVIADLKNKKYRTHINNLKRSATVDSYLVQPKKFPELLCEGLWGKATFEYIQTGDRTNINMCDFESYQTRGASIKSYIEYRKLFTTDEWIDFLIRTVGLNPSKFDKKTKIIYLCRLIPLLEPRTNIIEMGPPSTGKSYIYENLSFYSRLVLGGDITLAKLIYNLSTKESGLVFTQDVICFDEINKISRKKQEITSKLQQIMASGHVERGDLSARTDVGFVFQGNLLTREQDGKILPKFDDHFMMLPEEIKDSAFLDRFHGYIHGMVIFMDGNLIGLKMCILIEI
ncbi:MAG: BREX system Lon protease-like protein BrxL, partial [Promethearchaeota archaeon]